LAAGASPSAGIADTVPLAIAALKAAKAKAAILRLVMTTPPFWSPVHRHPDQKLSHTEFTDAEGLFSCSSARTAARRTSRRNALNDERRCIVFISWMTVF
jgi:hypothetical protein